jgi:hypothetical protein
MGHYDSDYEAHDREIAENREKVQVEARKQLERDLKDLEMFLSADQLIKLMDAYRKYWKATRFNFNEMF